MTDSMESADSKLNRREFLQKGAAVAAGGGAAVFAGSAAVTAESPATNTTALS